MSRYDDALRRRAVALGYREGEHAPKVKAKGKGFVAEEIIERAKSSSIPIQEDPSLVEMLSQLEVNEKIPEDLYEVVAEVFAFIYRIDREKGLSAEKHRGKASGRDGEKH
ncbi:EscU/YscU/HrcU family type III secretion system export apparatus switch protein [Alkalicoccus chagannorensis]|uniref:EscU/YscU/HrcU family type III secretion system export apparatus switch protein n=1 Tax=Alkalicoccus chagannorensis TaxID=427072 RepID=UPI000403009C|nr:EscU/YscU/HrcU family type III secretion system export apparatus switch protein [Alkalicoccus chagannorensis]